jgi:hypothetical protein
MNAERRYSLPPVRPAISWGEVSAGAGDPVLSCPVTSRHRLLPGRSSAACSRAASEMCGNKNMALDLVFRLDGWRTSHMGTWLFGDCVSIFNDIPCIGYMEKLTCMLTHLSRAGRKTCGAHGRFGCRLRRLQVCQGAVQDEDNARLQGCLFQPTLVDLPPAALSKLRVFESTISPNTSPQPLEYPLADNSLLCLSCQWLEPCHGRWPCVWGPPVVVHFPWPVERASLSRYSKAQVRNLK